MAANWASVSVGGEICAVKTGGTLWCWGNNAALGNGMPTYDGSGLTLLVTAPAQVGADTDWRTVMTTGSLSAETCAVKTDGSLWCWGFGAAPIPGIVTTPTPIR